MFRKKNKPSTPEVLETAQQRLTSPEQRPGESTGCSPPNHPKGTLSGEVLTQKQICPGLRRDNTGRTSGRRRHHTTDHRNVPEQERVTITEAGIPERVSGSV